MSNYNRIANVGNPYQNVAKHPRVLCVCSAGLLRSPTVAWILSNPPFNYNTRAVGSAKSFALVPIDEALMEWADSIVFVNKENYLETLSQHSVAEHKVIILDLPDNYGYRDPELVEIATKVLKEKFALI